MTTHEQDPHLINWASWCSSLGLGTDVPAFLGWCYENLPFLLQPGYMQGADRDTIRITLTPRRLSLFYGLSLDAPNVRVASMYNGTPLITTGVNITLGPREDGDYHGHKLEQICVWLLTHRDWVHGRVTAQLHEHLSTMRREGDLCEYDLAQLPTLQLIAVQSIHPSAPLWAYLLRHIPKGALGGPSLSLDDYCWERGRFVKTIPPERALVHASAASSIHHSAVEWVRRYTAQTLDLLRAYIFEEPGRDPEHPILTQADDVLFDDR